MREHLKGGIYFSDLNVIQPTSVMTVSNNFSRGEISSFEILEKSNEPIFLLQFTSLTSLLGGVDSAIVTFSLSRETGSRGRTTGICLWAVVDEDADWHVVLGAVSPSDSVRTCCK